MNLINKIRQLGEEKQRYLMRLHALTAGGTVIPFGQSYDEFMRLRERVDQIERERERLVNTPGQDRELLEEAHKEQLIREVLLLRRIKRVRMRLDPAPARIDIEQAPLVEKQQLMKSRRKGRMRGFFRFFIS